MWYKQKFLPHRRMAKYQWEGAHFKWTKVSDELNTSYGLSGHLSMASSVEWHLPSSSSNASKNPSFYLVMLC